MLSEPQDVLRRLVASQQKRNAHAQAHRPAGRVHGALTHPIFGAWHTLSSNGPAPVHMESGSVEMVDTRKEFAFRLRVRYLAVILLHCVSAACLSEASGIFAAAVRQVCFALLTAVFTFALLVVI